MDIGQTPNALRRTIQHAAPYDLVMANILARPLVELSAAITSFTARGGDIVLSGLLQSQQRQVEAAYRNMGAVVHRRVNLGDWSALWLKKR